MILWRIRNTEIAFLRGVYPEPYGAGFTLERNEGLRTGLGGAGNAIT